MENSSDQQPPGDVDGSMSIRLSALWKSIEQSHTRARQVVAGSTFLTILLSLAPIIVGFLIPSFWMQIVCVLWGALNLFVLARFLLRNAELRSGRRLVVSFSAVISVTQLFGSSYAATLLSSDHYKHFRFSEFSTAADFHDQRLAAQFLADLHADAIGKLNRYVEEQVHSGSSPPDGFPFNPTMTRFPCPNSGLAYMVWYVCHDTDPADRAHDALYKAEQLVPLLFEWHEPSEGMYVLRTRDTRASVVAILANTDTTTSFLDLTGATLSVSFYKAWEDQDIFANPYRRRDMIEHFAAIAKSSLREYRPEPRTLLPVSLASDEMGSGRFRSAVANTLICMQDLSSDYSQGPCTPQSEFAALLSPDGWSAGGSKPGVLMTALRPLDYVLQAYLSEILYWDIATMETTADRRDLVTNGMIFSAMAVMTSGFSDMSPQSYLAKCLLILQFLAYVLLIILILPMSIERPREDP